MSRPLDEQLDQAVQMTAEERLECERSADKAAEPPAEWIRRHLIHAAKRKLEESE